MLGMSESEVVAAVGKPIRKKRVTLHRRPRTEWVYSSYSLYFDNDGFLVDWDY